MTWPRDGEEAGRERRQRRGKRAQEEGTGPAVGPPLASPRGLKEAVGVTVLVEPVMKLERGQKIPERQH